MWKFKKKHRKNKSSTSSSISESRLHDGQDSLKSGVSNSLQSVAVSMDNMILSEKSGQADGNARTSTEKAVTVDKVEDNDVPSNVTVEDSSTLGKMKAMFGILSKFVGVKDLVSLRVSLPAQLLDPVSNLEFWSYMDCPGLFGIIADPDDPLDRMLNVIRFWYSKDTKFLAKQLSKPYNSLIGEQFICWYEVTEEEAYKNHPSTTILSEYFTDKDREKKSDGSKDPQFTVWSLVEQISHHPPVSAYYYYCPEKDIVCRGLDHICAKFTGTSAKIFPGPWNHGLYIHLGTRDNEEYNLTHPTAYVNGWLKMSLYITVGEQCVIRCPKTGLMAILDYKEESFFGKKKFAIEGKIIKYNPGEDDFLASPVSPTSPTQANNPAGGFGPIKLSKIAEDDTLCTISGSWKGKIYYQKKNEETPSLLIDMETLQPHEKSCRPLEEQQPNESRKLWHEVTENIKNASYSAATKFKRELEDKQRAEERERKEKGSAYDSKWFGFLWGVESHLEPSRKDDIILEGGDLDAWVAGKPFLKKSIQKELPWNSYKKK